MTRYYSVPTETPDDLQVVLRLSPRIPSSRLRAQTFFFFFLLQFFLATSVASRCSCSSLLLLLILRLCCSSRPANFRRRLIHILTEEEGQKKLAIVLVGSARVACCVSRIRNLHASHCLVRGAFINDQSTTPCQLAQCSRRATAGIRKRALFFSFSLHVLAPTGWACRTLALANRPQETSTSHSESTYWQDERLETENTGPAAQPPPPVPCACQAVGSCRTRKQGRVACCADY